jgi:hypothetical protein
MISSQAAIRFRSLGNEGGLTETEPNQQKLRDAGPTLVGPMTEALTHRKSLLFRGPDPSTGPSAACKRGLPMTSGYVKQQSSPHHGRTRVYTRSLAFRGCGFEFSGLWVYSG